MSGPERVHRPEGHGPAALAEAFRSTRQLTRAITEPLSPEDQTAQSMPDVSPTKWHLAHTTWFFEEFVLGPHQPDYRPFHPGFRYLFNSYYDAVGSRHPRAERGSITRPGVAEVDRYRAQVDDAIADLLSGPVPPEVRALVELGIHHEQQHQELALMDVKHVLSRNILDPAYLDTHDQTAAAVRGTAGTRPVPRLRWIEHPGGQVEIGHRGPGFAFDNERPRHREFLEPFALADRPVSCGEVAEFIADGGYHRPDLWLSDGWATVQAERWEAPLYWQPSEPAGTGWTTFTLSGRRDLVAHEPAVHLSLYEADAIARWSGARLPTEAEWEALAADTPVAGNLLDLSVLHPLGPATDADPAPGSGPAQLFGDVWEWTASAYLPYPGFRAAPGAVGEYNGKFMVNQHVLRGGSCVTPADHIRVTYRNFFPPSARWLFAGVRLARHPEAT